VVGANLSGGIVMGGILSNSGGEANHSISRHLACSEGRGNQESGNSRKSWVLMAAGGSSQAVRGSFPSAIARQFGFGVC
jgi:hypothetical protein